jgi:hypothetical protein
MRNTLSLALILLPALTFAEPWRRHVIDDSSRGADGVKLADLNGDGLLDIVTPWEEGGLVRVYLNPGREKAKQRWPAVTVGRIGDPEEAVFADVDNDGVLDVVSCCEGKTQAIYLHRLTDPGRPLDEASWTTERIPAADGRRWMQCLPISLGPHRTVLIVGSKENGGTVAALIPPEATDTSADWRLVPLAEAGWVMSILPLGGQPPAVLVSDRRGPTRGVFLLRASHEDWRHWSRLDLFGNEHEVMFAAGDPAAQLAAATRGGPILLFTSEGRNSRDGGNTNSAPLEQRLRHGTITAIPMPDGTGTGKAVAIGDLDGDNVADLAVTCENAKGKIGVFWLQATPHTSQPPEWHFHDISGLEGTKFDRIELIDLDGDGDLDLLTCEETEGLGVIWYENPAR